jgi:Ca2+/Na+ antiporter
VTLVEHWAACLNIPTDIVGVTVLAIGTSAPDCIGSVLVAKKGKVNMAVANAFGSNVFDLCFCIGVRLFKGKLLEVFSPYCLGPLFAFSAILFCFNFVLVCV